MKIVLASSNKGKIKEFKELMPSFEIIAYEELLGEMEIEETGASFKENAIIKAQAISEKLKDENIIVISDDSGITVPELNNEPSIFSARYAGIGSSAKQNNEKLISRLKESNIKRTPAFYTACIALAYKGEIYTVHGFMFGEVIDEQRGEKGFGYDPLFIPKGFDMTLGELENEIKQSFSHRTKALDLAKKILDILL